MHATPITFERHEHVATTWPCLICQHCAQRLVCNHQQTAGMVGIRQQELMSPSNRFVGWDGSQVFRASVLRNLLFCSNFEFVKFLTH